MTKDDYRGFLTKEIKALTELLSDGISDITATALLICERNRLVDKLYEFEMWQAIETLETKE